MKVQRTVEVPLKKTVILDIDVEGFHRWEQAPDEVSFLRHRHRHLFRIRAGVEVIESDREKEIFIMQGHLRQAIAWRYRSMRTTGGEVDFFNDSCEMIAEKLLDELYDQGFRWIEVLEDGRGGARVEAR